MKHINLCTVIIFLSLINLYPQKVGDSYRLNINNINLPMNNRGVLADVNISPGGPGGQFGGNRFLFSSGFFLSGYNDGQLWANGVASASLVEDYLQGTYEFGQNDPRAQLYKLRYDDVPFGQSWIDWVDAVALGADFYDGNGDGVYNPVDLNGNNQWDPDEDHPDLLGDELLWCVYHDAAAGSRWVTVQPQGIEIRQSVFAYSTVPALQNVIFIRYKILNTGTVASEMNDVYFSFWQDPDIGDYTDDAVGCDTSLQAGYTYNDGDDAIYGTHPPCFISSKLSGPAAYIPGETFIDTNSNGVYDEGIDTPIDTAYVYKGQILGIVEYPGARNQNLSSSMHYMQSDPTLGDPTNKEAARNLMLGRNLSGGFIDPCTWIYGKVVGGADCSLINPVFLYSGDLIAYYGWLNDAPTDQRQMQNIGPFKLEAGKEIEIFAAYVVGQGSNYILSIPEAKDISIQAQAMYDFNFDPSGLPVFVQEENDDQLIESYQLSQNYPNPFNPTTKIKFTIPGVGDAKFASPTNVLLKVFDVLGKEVVTLVNEDKPEGEYGVEFNASGLPSGIYFYQLRAGSYVETKKMLLLK